MIRLPKGTAITIFGIGSRPLNKRYGFNNRKYTINTHTNMNDEILIINEYPIGWGWLKDVPLIDWEWLIDVFATMTDDTDTYSYITYAEEDGAKLTDITFVRTVGLAKFLYDDQGYLAGIREYGHYIAAKALDIKSERDYLNHYNDIRLICNEL